MGKISKKMLLTVVVLVVVAFSGTFLVLDASTSTENEVVPQGQGVVSFQVVDPTDDVPGKVSFTVVESKE